MRALESFIFVAVLLFAIGGLFYLYQGPGLATKRLPGCEGGFVVPYLSLGGLSANYKADYSFRGLAGSIELVDVNSNRAMLNVDGTMTTYLTEGQVWIGEQIGIKISGIDRNSVGFCVASSIPECIDRYWDINTRQRECGRWQSQAERLF